MSQRLPERGRPWDALSREMTDLKRDDLDWRGGRHAAFVWHADESVERVAREAYGLFMTENGLGLRVFPSLRRLCCMAWPLLFFSFEPVVRRIGDVTISPCERA